MSNFSPKLQDATDIELIHMINEFDFSVVHLASDELTRRTIRELEKTIKIFNDKSAKQTEKLITLTWWIVALTIVIVMVLGLAAQIILAF